jgi:hypothetical protein
MATGNRNAPPWYDPEDEYIVYGGNVRNASGEYGDYVPALSVARALLLPTSLPNVRLAQDFGEVSELIQRGRGRSRAHLFLHGPQDGHYSGNRWIPYQLAQVRNFLDSTPRSPRLMGGYTVGAFRNWHRIEDEFYELVENVGGEGWTPRMTIDYLDRVERGSRMVGVDPGVLDLTNTVIRDAAGNIYAQGGYVSVAQIHDSTIMARDINNGMERLTQLPQEGSKPWRRIQAKGCVGKKNESGVFTCPDYAWDCEPCPAYTGEKWEPGKQHRLKRLIRMKSISKKD